MKEEDFIKRLVQLAEGFKLIVSDYYIRVTFRTGIVLSKNIRKWIFYPLLLYREMEGWNKKSKDIGLELTKWGNVVITNGNCNVMNIYYQNKFQPTNYLTPQEQALEDALKEILANE